VSAVPYSSPCQPRTSLGHEVISRQIELGCDTLQGFYLCRPQAAPDVIATLDALDARFGLEQALAS
jgi:hypothetical protein